MEGLLLRRMTRQDLDRVWEIENISFLTPWSRRAFEEELRNEPRSYFVVAELDGHVVGYAGLWRIGDEGHIVNIAVHPDYRGRKVGELLLRDLIEEALAGGACRLTLEVRTSNLVAQRLYEKYGFIKVAIRKEYYSRQKEDAVVMWANDVNTPDYRARLEALARAS